MAALKIMDSKMTGCFLKGSLQQESMAKFKKILAVIQSFYQIELPNLKFCVDSCYPKTKCVQKKQENSNQQEIVDLIQKYCFVRLDRDNNDVKVFKSFVMTVD